RGAESLRPEPLERPAPALDAAGLNGDDRAQVPGAGKGCRRGFVHENDTPALLVDPADHPEGAVCIHRPGLLAGQYLRITATTIPWIATSDSSKNIGSIVAFAGCSRIRPARSR